MACAPLVPPSTSMPLRIPPLFVALHFGAVVWWSLKGLQCSLKTFAVWVGELNGSLRRRWAVEGGQDEVESGLPGWVRLLTRLLMKNALELKRQASRGSNTDAARLAVPQNAVSCQGISLTRGWLP